jgi:hypothetical protein
VSKGEHRPGSGQNDHWETNELGGHTKPRALGVAFVQEAKTRERSEVFGSRIKPKAVESSRE